eukprot:CAMPEP_0172611580 /NCGR_PEP_ID=MMETSP1068-20121228/31252_1 /TAXON_ID=35684 /ORGANISM="Pseudopedinella elastica, Strain CCMP716" /LENGTH=235 /DNA_ID=CAMNT_0013415597 /DNA_START=141 /DNA_END=848 /DNA_ORIENTATION=+
MDPRTILKIIGAVLVLLLVNLLTFAIGVGDYAGWHQPAWGEVLFLVVWSIMAILYLLSLLGIDPLSRLDLKDYELESVFKRIENTKVPLPVSQCVGAVSTHSGAWWQNQRMPDRANVEARLNQAWLKIQETFRIPRTNGGVHNDPEALQQQPSHSGRFISRISNTQGASPRQSFSEDDNFSDPISRLADEATFHSAAQESWPQDEEASSKGLSGPMNEGHSAAPRLSPDSDGDEL